MTNNDNCTIMDKVSIDTGKVINSNLSCEFNMDIRLYDKDGNLKDSRLVHNTTTSAAKYGIMDQVLDITSLSKPGWMELGTGSPAATLLGAYIAGSRTAFTSKTRLNNVVTMSTLFVAGVGTGAITEAGIFDVVTQNTVNMWCSASFAVINKGASDTLTITWTLTGN